VVEVNIRLRSDQALQKAFGRTRPRDAQRGKLKQIGKKKTTIVAAR
jgi:hypothetical protein